MCVGGGGSVRFLEKKFVRADEEKRQSSDLLYSRPCLWLFFFGRRKGMNIDINIGRKRSELAFGFHWVLTRVEHSEGLQEEEVVVMREGIVIHTHTHTCIWCQ